MLLVTCIELGSFTWMYQVIFMLLEYDIKLNMTATCMIKTNAWLKQMHDMQAVFLCTVLPQIAAGLV